MRTLPPFCRLLPEQEALHDLAICEIAEPPAVTSVEAGVALLVLTRMAGQSLPDKQLQKGQEFDWHACACRYHSHPVFEPRPSQKDCENQRNYQALFRCGETGLEPFLGAIIGPYNPQLPSPVSSSCPWPATVRAEPLPVVPSLLCQTSEREE